MFNRLRMSVKTIAEIIDLAISSPDNLPAAMLHCKVLADGLGHEPFNHWVTREIDGFADSREVPGYRRVRGRLEGKFERYLIDITDDAVPRHLLGTELHTLVETINFVQPVGTLAAYPDDGSLGFPVGREKELLALLNSHFGGHGRFLTLWVKCGPGSIRPVLAAIQHKLVPFLSEINQLFPDMDQISTPSSDDSAVIDQSFDKYLRVDHANNIIISPSHVHVDQSSRVFQQINVGNWPGLDDFLERQNIPVDKRESAKNILEKIEQGDESTETQSELKEWIDDTAGDMASGVGEVLNEATKKAAIDTLVDALKRYAPTIAKWGWVIGSSLV